MNNRQLWENIFQISQAVFRVTHLFPKDEILRRHLREKITEILYQVSQDSETRRGLISSIQEVNPRHTLIADIHNFRSLLFAAQNCNFVDERNLAVLIKECAKVIDMLVPREVDFSERDSSNIQEIKSMRFNPPVPIFLEKSGMLDCGAIGTGGQAIRSLSSPRKQESGAISKSKSIPTSIRQLADQLPTSAQSDIGFSILNGRQQKLLDYFQKISEDKIRLKDVAEKFKDIPPRTIRQDLKNLCDSGFLIHNGFGPGSFYTKAMRHNRAE